MPDPGHHFAVYLVDGDEEYQLGALTGQPNNGVSYRLIVPGEEIPVLGEELTWQVRLESVDGSEVAVASRLIPIIIVSGEPTATTTATITATLAPGEPSATPTVAEACVISPPPNWVLYNVRAGDALSDLAERANLEVETLIRVNCLANDLLSVGQPLWLPLAAVPRTPTPTSPPAPPTNPPPVVPSATTEQTRPTTPPQPPPTEQPTDEPTQEPEPPTLTPPVPTPPGQP